MSYVTVKDFLIIASFNAAACGCTILDVNFQTFTVEFDGPKEKQKECAQKLEEILSSGQKEGLDHYRNYPLNLVSSCLTGDL